MPWALKTVTWTECLFLSHLLSLSLMRAHTHTHTHTHKNTHTLFLNTQTRGSPRKATHIHTTKTVKCHSETDWDTLVQLRWDRQLNTHCNLFCWHKRYAITVYGKFTLAAYVPTLWQWWSFCILNWDLSLRHWLVYWCNSHKEMLDNIHIFAAIIQSTLNISLRQLFSQP